MLKIKDFTKVYANGKVAVDRLNLTVEAGDIFGFIGHNGAGKTTTIRAAAGVLDFSEGEITVDRYSIKEEPIKAKEMLAYIPDNPELYDHLTGVQYINFIGDMYRVPLEERRRLIGQYADLLEMSGSLGSLISSYSHGMKQKLALISAFLHSPKLVILDEPFVGLDPRATHILKELMKEMCRAGCAFFFSTHILEQAEKLCDKIAIIKDGKLVACGPTDEVRGNVSLEDVFMELYDNE